MPFILRRTKDSVLSDLPPKVLQDILCDLSALQVSLYDEFTKSAASLEIQGAVTARSTSQSDGGAAKTAPHVFQVSD